MVKSNSAKKVTKSKPKSDEKFSINIDSLKKTLKDSDKKPLGGESELELDLERFASITVDSDDDVDLGMNNFEFQNGQVRTSGDSGSPVLERIAGAGPRPVFVRTRPGSGPDSNDDEAPSYISSGASANDPKYISEPGARNPEYVNTTGLGRNSGFREEISREAQFIDPIGSRAEAATQEKTWRVDRFEAERAGRQDMFANQEKKYDKYIPKVPK